MVGSIRVTRSCLTTSQMSLLQNNLLLFLGYASRENLEISVDDVL